MMPYHKSNLLKIMGSAMKRTRFFFVVKDDPYKFFSIILNTMLSCNNFWLWLSKDASQIVLLMRLSEANEINCSLTLGKKLIVNLCSSFSWSKDFRHQWSSYQQLFTIRFTFEFIFKQHLLPSLSLIDTLFIIWLYSDWIYLSLRHLILLFIKLCFAWVDFNYILKGPKLTCERTECF